MVVSDLVIQILSKLSPESLLRFKSVCKSWYALIDDPKFVTKHLLDSFPHKHILLKRIVTNDSGKREYMFSILKFSLDRSVSSVLDIPLPFHEDYGALSLNGQSHGLICLSDDDNIFLCNPMTRQFRKLPPTIFKVHEPQNDPDFCFMPMTTGFGYDVKCGDFKVVRVVRPWRGVVCHPAKVEIYDLRKDRWREIKTSLSVYTVNTTSFEMYHEGTFYWRAMSYYAPEEVILTFDMSKEVFGKISVPKLPDFDIEWSHRSLLVLNGSFYLFFYQFRGNEKVFEILEMEKDGSGGVSWSKLLTIGPLFGIDYPFLFLSSSELLLESKEGQVILYNCKTQQIKELQVRGEEISKDLNRFEATNLFVKSLVSVEGGNNMRYEF